MKVNVKIYFHIKILDILKGLYFINLVYKALSFLNERKVTKTFKCFMDKAQPATEPLLKKRPRQVFNQVYFQYKVRK